MLRGAQRCPGNPELKFQSRNFNWTCSLALPESRERISTKRYTSRLSTCVVFHSPSRKMLIQNSQQDTTTCKPLPNALFTVVLTLDNPRIDYFSLVSEFHGDQHQVPAAVTYWTRFGIYDVPIEESLAKYFRIRFYGTTASGILNTTACRIMQNDRDVFATWHSAWNCITILHHHSAKCQSPTPTLKQC